MKISRRRGLPPGPRKLIWIPIRTSTAKCLFTQDYEIQEQILKQQEGKLWTVIRNNLLGLPLDWSRTKIFSEGLTDRNIRDIRDIKKRFTAYDTDPQYDELRAQMYLRRAIGQFQDPIENLRNLQYYFLLKGARFEPVDSVIGMVRQREHEFKAFGLIQESPDRNLLDADDDAVIKELKLARKARNFRTSTIIRGINKKLKYDETGILLIDFRTKPSLVDFDKDIEVIGLSSELLEIARELREKNSPSLIEFLSGRDFGKERQ